MSMTIQPGPAGDPAAAAECSSAVYGMDGCAEDSAERSPSPPAPDDGREAPGITSSERARLITPAGAGPQSIVTRDGPQAAPDTGSETEVPADSPGVAPIAIPDRVTAACRRCSRIARRLLSAIARGDEEGAARWRGEFRRAYDLLSTFVVDETLPVEVRRAISREQEGMAKFLTWSDADLLEMLSAERSLFLFQRLRR